MFDDEQATKQAPPSGAGEPSGARPPGNLPAKEPEDMLANVDPSRPTEPPTESRGHVSPQRPTESAIPTEYLEEQSRIPKFVWMVGSLVVVGLVVVGGGYGYLQWSVGREATPVEQPAANGESDTPLVPVTPNSDLSPQGAWPTSFIDDADGDGLSVEQELAAGTDIENPDTDGDGLFDGEEVLVFGTDPLNPDTDGDGFLDGEEVRNGYNPRGPGRLFSVPQ